MFQLFYVFCYYLLNKFYYTVCKCVMCKITYDDHYFFELLINPRMALMAGGRRASKIELSLCNNKFFFILQDTFMSARSCNTCFLDISSFFYTLRNMDVAMYDIIVAATNCMYLIRFYCFFLLNRMGHA